MASSDDFANDVLTAAVTAGGSWWFGVLDAVPADDLSTFSLVSAIPRVAIPRTALAWVVADRQANPVDAISLDTSALVGDVVPVAWCLFDDSAGTLPRIAGRLADVKVTPGSVVNVPAATVAIRFPASVAALL